MKKTLNIKLIILYIIGIIAMSTQRMKGLGIIYGIALIVWLTDFIYLFCISQTKRQLLITSICLFIGTFLRLLGLSGILAVDILIVSIYSIIVSGAFILYRFLYKRWNNIFITLFIPLFWLIIFYIFTMIRIPSLLRFDLLLFDCLHIAQLSSIISVIGLNVITVWIAALIAQGIINHTIINGIIAISIIIIMIIVGEIQVSKPAEVSGTIRIGYSTGAYVGDFLNCQTLSYDECVASFNKVFSDAIKQKVDLLAFSEETYEINDIDENKFLTVVKESAKENNIFVLIGLDLQDTDNSENGKSINKIIFISDKGEIINEYAKCKIIPFIEDDYKAGNGVIPTSLINIKGLPIKISFAICYDSNFPVYIKQMPSDTQLFILPSWDWDGISYEHSRICGNIAIENRVSLLKPTYDGYTIAVDPYGNIIDFKSTNDTGYENLQLVDMPIYNFSH